LIKTGALEEQTIQELNKIGSADIIVGIPSYNNASTIDRVIKAADLGLARYFNSARCVILVSEGGDLQATQSVVDALKNKSYFESALVPEPKYDTEIIVTKYRGTSGKGTAVKAIFEAAHILNVKAGCMLDADLRSITPEWIELLIAPVILKGFGFVAPYYRRHKYDGTITNMIAFPLTCALYGRRVRQPIGGDFGFSIDLIKSLLEKDVWETDIARFGIDIWMTTVAICEGFKICQSFLGAKIHDEKDPGKDLSPMFKQVVGTLFSLMNIYTEKWKQVRGSRPTAIFGFETESVPKPINIDLDNMINKFKEMSGRYKDIWEKILQRENFEKLMEVSRMDINLFEMPVDLWVRSLYDFAVAYNFIQEGVNKLDILDALVPVYYAITASFVRKTRNLETHEAEEIVFQHTHTFERLKPYLIERWDLYDKQRRTQ